MSRPRLLDVYCCLGGAAMGYHRAGFEVVGVDVEPQPDYPFEFVQAEAVTFLREHAAEIRRDFDAVHASPPCQAAAGPTSGTNAKRNAERGIAHPQLIPPTREALDAIGLPYVIENVEGRAPMRVDVKLCGLMFAETRRVFRHRQFELGGWIATAPAHPSHKGHRVSGWRHGVRYEGDMLAVYGKGGGKATTAECREGLGIDWSWDRDRLVEAIPPAYTEYIGRHLLERLVQPLAA